jgi:hypothetical protein
METVRMVIAVHMEHDHLLKSPHLIKKDDPGVPTIQCSINRSSFNKAVYDTGSDINIMAKVTYEYLYGTMPLEPTYAQLQMADQTFCFVKGIVKYVPIQIDDHYVPTDFLVIDMGEDYDPPIILGRPFLNTTKAIIYIGIGEIHFHFPSEKVRRYFNDYYIISEEPKKNKSKRRQRTHHQNKKNVIVDGWADYEGEVTRFEDQEMVTKEVEEIQLAEEKIVTTETSSSKSPSPTKKVWKVKEKSDSELAQGTAPPEAPSDAPLEQ